MTNHSNNFTHLLYISLKVRDGTGARTGMLGKLAAAGRAAVAKCVAPGGATHEQVDGAPQAHKKKQNKTKKTASARKKQQRRAPRAAGASRGEAA